MDCNLELVSEAELLAEIMRRNDAVVIGTLNIRRRGRKIEERFKPAIHGSMTMCSGVAARLQHIILTYQAQSQITVNDVPNEDAGD